MTAIRSPIDYYADLSGRPNENGSVYFGVAGQDPETNPITVYWDEALTQVATQPLTMTAGYIVHTGSRAQVYTSETEWSVRTKNSSGSQIDYFASASSPVRASDLASTASGKGAALVGFISDIANAVAQTVNAVLRLLMPTPETFGAVADSTGTDNTVALNRWLAAAAAGRAVRLPNKKYYFASALTAISASNISIKGDGLGALVYNGASTTPGDLLTIGDGVSTYDNIRIFGLRIDSNTVLTSGRALRIRNCRMVHLDIAIDGDDENDLSNTYDGLWLQACTLIYLYNSRFTAGNTSVKWSDGIALHCMNTFIKGHGATAATGVGTGLHLAGGCADLNTENLSQLLNDIGIKVDNTVSASANQQLFLDFSTKIDSNKTAGVSLNDSVAGTLSKVLDCNAWIKSTGAGGGLVIANWTGGYITSGDGRFANCSGSGIYSADTSATLTLGAGVQLTDNGAYGVDASGAWTINSRALRTTNNTSGIYSSNVKNRGVSIAYNPTVSWGVDQTAGGTTALASGASITLSAGAGLVIVVNDSTGNSGVFHCYGGNVVKITGAGTIVAGAPGASEIGFQYSGGSYLVTNGYASSQNIYISTFRARPTS